MDSADTCGHLVFCWTCHDYHWEGKSGVEYPRWIMVRGEELKGYIPETCEDSIEKENR